MSSTDRQRWQTAINDELQSMDEQHVWTIVPRLQRHTVGSNWVFVIKTNEHSQVTRYQARLAIE